MRVSKYQNDSRITDKDSLLGTDGNNGNKTKNFPLGDISEYILALLRNSGVVFRFSDGSDPDKAIGDPGYFFSQTNITDKSQATKLYFSAETYYGEQLAELFDSVKANVGELYLRLVQEGDTANFGFFDVSNVTKVDTYYEIDIVLREQLYAKEFVHDKNYTLSFDLANVNEYTVDLVDGVIQVYKNETLIKSLNIQDYIDTTNLTRLIDGTDANFYIDEGNVLRSNISTYKQILTKEAGGSQIWTLDFEPTNFLMIDGKADIFPLLPTEYIFTPPNTFEITATPALADGEKVILVYEHFITSPA